MIFLPLLALAGAVLAQSSTAATQQVKSLDDCHLHELTQFCIAQPSGKEIEVTTAKDATAAKALPTTYLDCHTHGGETFCVGPTGDDILIPALSTPTTDDHSDHAGESEATHAGETAEEHAAHAGEVAEDTSSAEQTCHFHAGVEHCTGGPKKAAGSDACARQDRSYNVPWRIGSIFIVLCTSSIAVFLPLVLRRFTAMDSKHVGFSIIKQFGTGVIIATAFIHLLTHAEMMFSNDCVGSLGYEATTTAIAMAGLIAAALVEYIGHRYIDHRTELAAARSTSDASSGEFGAGSNKEASENDHHQHQLHHNTAADDKLSVFVMEMGIIFHSILIGITLVVAGDQVFKSLLVVIIFHQGFEGLALGTRIAGLAPEKSLNMMKIGMATLFALITPIGMAIGVGVRNHFNGNDRSTLLTLGTLDALSAGILVWVGVVEMLAADWLHGDLRRASMARTAIAGFSLFLGMALMGLLGKWA
ncbi:ZIP zinc transporter-domain-containing protein [Pyronema omphalodes]|nr:ZIP zinc transporter-domain-containing protein [Pyronema omphalodes]